MDICQYRKSPWGISGEDYLLTSMALRRADCSQA